MNKKEHIPRDPEKIDHYSTKVSGWVFNRIKELKVEEDFKSDNQVLETVLEFYDNSVNSKKEEKEYRKENAELQEEIKRLSGILEESRQKAAQESSRLSEVNTGLEHDYNELLIKHNELRQSHESCVSITPKNLAVLSYVAERETAKRKQPIDKNMIVNFLLETRFIKNKLSGGLDTVPAHILKKII